MDPLTSANTDEENTERSLNKPTAFASRITDAKAAPTILRETTYRRTERDSNAHGTTRV